MPLQLLEPWFPPFIALTRSWEDVDHALGNASLQGQLCKLQGCEWGHLRRQERRLGQERLRSGALSFSLSSLGSNQGGTAVAGRPTGEDMFMPHRSGYQQPSQPARGQGLLTLGTFLAPSPGRVPAPLPGLGPFLHVSLFTLIPQGVQSLRTVKQGITLRRLQGIPSPCALSKLASSHCDAALSSPPAAGPWQHLSPRRAWCFRVQLKF